MSTPDQYGQQPWPGPTGNPGSPPQYPPRAPLPYPPAQPQYPPPTSQPTYGAPQYPPPAQPSYGAPQYPSPQSPSPQYPSQQYPSQQYPPQQQYPDQQGQLPPGTPPPPFSGLGEIPPAPPPQKRSPLKVLGSIGVTVLIILGIVGVRIALRDGFGSDSSSASAPKTPFEGTPADTFPQGEAGIVLPAATELTGFTKEQVAAALEKVKSAMIAARLDTTMLVKHDTSVLLGLIAAEGQQDITDLFAKKDFMHFATQIAPNYNLTADKIRVKGDMTFSARTEEDIRFIEVKTNYVWVYPFAGELKEPGDHLVTVHDEITWLFPANADVPPEFRGMYIDSTQSYSSNIDCDLADQSLLALGKPRFVPGGATVDDNQVFDPNGSLDLGNTC